MQPKLSRLPTFGQYSVALITTILRFMMFTVSVRTYVVQPSERKDLRNIQSQNVLFERSWKCHLKERFSIDIALGLNGPDDMHQLTRKVSGHDFSSCSARPFLPRLEQRCRLWYFAIQWASELRFKILTTMVFVSAGPFEGTPNSVWLYRVIDSETETRSASGLLKQHPGQIVGIIELERVWRF